MRAYLLILLSLACALPAHAEDCTARAVNRGLGSPDDQWPASCPKADPAKLLGPDTASALILKPDNAQHQSQLLAALHALASAAQLERPWGPSFAEHLDKLITDFDPKRCDAPWEISWSAPRAPTEPIGECHCAFEVGAEGDAGHACFRFPPADGTSLPACQKPGLQVYDLPDWPAVARAYALSDLAHGALLSLSDDCRKLVVMRLSQAEERWHRLVTRGAVQYPWELWFSRLLSHDYSNYSRCFAADPSCTGQEGLDPETTRAIFLHPGVGLGFPGFGKHDGKVSAQARVVIDLEVFGLNFYDSDFKEFFGASLGVGFQDANFARPRLGAFVHLSRYLSVGYLFGIVSETRSQGTLYMTMDVLGWANRSLGLTELH